MIADPIVSAFDDLARRDAGAPIVASPSCGATRGDVHALSLVVAATIDASRVPRGGHVLLACANGAGFLASLLGVRRAGRVAVLADWTAPTEERVRIARALGAAAAVVCDRAFPDRAAAPRLTTLPANASPPLRGAEYVKVTSGSSGAPSGVAAGAASLCADDDQISSTMELHAGDRFLADIPWSHSYALSSAVLPALRRGSLLVLSDDAGPWGPLAAARALGATVFPTVPVYLHAIASLADPPPWPETIRRVISAGATLRPETAARFREVYGPCAHVFYGASESGGICYDRTGDAALRGTVGTPLDGVRVDIEEGAVRVRSEAVGLGYVPAAKASLRDGRFVTADLGAWTADGELELLGRADAMINAGGKKVQPAEVESVLRAMPGVRDVVVFGVPCGVGEREIVRAVIACDTGRIAYVEVTAWCRDRLAAHKVPRSIVFVEVIPRTPRGKIDRAALDAAEPVLE